MRARFHVDGGRAGFYREGSHELCDAAATGQLTMQALDVVHAAVGTLAAAGAAACCRLSSPRTLLPANARSPSRSIASRPGSTLARRRRAACDRRRRHAARAGRPRSRRTSRERWRPGGQRLAERTDDGRVDGGISRAIPRRSFRPTAFCCRRWSTPCSTPCRPRSPSSICTPASGCSPSPRRRPVATAIVPSRGSDERRRPAAERRAVRGTADACNWRQSRRRCRHCRAGGTAIVDPPRTGMSPQAMDAMLRASRRGSSMSPAIRRRWRGMHESCSTAATCWRRCARSISFPTPRTSSGWACLRRGRRCEAAAFSPSPAVTNESNSGANSPVARSSPGATARRCRTPSAAVSIASTMPSGAVRPGDEAGAERGRPTGGAGC